ncbi:MAG: hypothetical protein KIS76_14125 [Pyrinomonadaceae bacterium]|nr:hypothetical protein [Pyrinomonadaceae bacterium]
MKRALIFILLLVLSAGVFAQTQPRGLDFTEFGVRIEPDKRVIVVLAALEAAGINTPLTEKGDEFRRKLNADIAGISPALKTRMSTFVAQYKKRNARSTDSEIIAPFVQMAYALDPVPDLTEPSRSTDLPGELLDVLDFAPLVRDFFREVKMSQKIDDYYKEYQKIGDAMRPSTAVMVGTLLDYLNTRPELSYVERVKNTAQAAKGTKRKIEATERRERDRRFFVVPELLAPKGTINFVNVGDDYYAIVPPGTDLSTSEARRAFLQFVLDPVVLDNTEQIFAQRPAIKTLLDARRKINPSISPDFVLAISRSLVAAVDARQVEYERSRIANLQARQAIAAIEVEDEKLKKEGKFVQTERDALKKAVVAKLNEFTRQLSDETAVLLSDAYESGAVLVFHFADKLKGMEDSGFDITESVGNMIASLDAAKETDRIAEFSEARARGIAERERRKLSIADQANVIENPLTKRLLEIETEIKSKNYDVARISLKNLLKTEPVENDPNEKVRVFYSLGRVESLSAEAANNPEDRNNHLVAAQQAYSNVIKFKTDTTDKALISLAYVALARIYEFSDQSEYAVKVYEAAINVGDIPGGAYAQAVAARERLLKDQ